MSKFSIIITVTNSDYDKIERCINSALNQSYKDFSILIITYGNSNSITQKINAITNGIQNISILNCDSIYSSDARNIGISSVNSDYFIFLDASDYLFNDLLENLNEYTSQNTDIISFSAYYKNETIESYGKIFKPTFDKTSGKEALKLFYNPNDFKFFDYVWGYAFSTKYIKSLNVKFQEKTYYENIFFIPYVIYNAKSVISTNICGYYYFRNFSYIHENSYSKIALDHRIDNILKAFDYYKSLDYSSYDFKIINEGLIKTFIYTATYLNKQDLQYFIKQIKSKKAYNIFYGDSKTDKLHRFLFKHFTYYIIVFGMIFGFNKEYIIPEKNRKQFYTILNIECFDKYYNILNSNRSYYGKRFAIIWLFIKTLVKNVFNYNKIALEYLEISITSKCTQKCKNCSNMMQYYDKPNNYSIDNAIQSLERLMKINKISYIKKLRILGGEPFLNPQIDKLINYTKNNYKIKEIAIATNGTVIPNNETINSLKDKKIKLHISNYGINIDKINNIIRLLDKEDIRYSIIDYYNDQVNLKWLYYGDPRVNQNKSIKSLKNQFAKCGYTTRCMHILDGKLHICPISANGMKLGFIKDDPNEYIDLLDKKISNSKIFNKIKYFINDIKYITACNYCNIGTKKAIRVIPGEQLVFSYKKNNKISN